MADVERHTEDWAALPWKPFQRNVYRLQKRIYQATRRGDWKRAHNLQRLLLRLSRAGRKCTTDVHQECATDVHRKCTRHVHRKCTTYVRPKCTTHVHQHAPPCPEPAPATSKAGSEPGGRTRTMETPSPGRVPGDALLLMAFSMLVPTAPPVPAVCGSERGSCRRG